MAWVRSGSRARTSSGLTMTYRPGSISNPFTISSNGTSGSVGRGGSGDLAAGALAVRVVGRPYPVQLRPQRLPLVRGRVPRPVSAHVPADLDPGPRVRLQVQRPRWMPGPSPVRPGDHQALAVPDEQERGG